VRIALVENEQRIRQAARNIKRFLAKLEQDGQSASLQRTGS
jgi:alanine-synthesizing transaminase